MKKIKPGDFVTIRPAKGKPVPGVWLVADTYPVQEKMPFAHAEMYDWVEKATLYRVTRAGHIRGRSPRDFRWTMRPDSPEAQPLVVNLADLVRVPKNQVYLKPQEKRKGAKAHEKNRRTNA